MGPDMSIIHGRARHPQSQGSVERANSDIKKMLTTWMRENKSTKWSIGVKFVQLRKNHTLHTANKCSPYKAAFGIETPLGLTSTVVPVELWSQLKTPKELFDAVGVTYDEMINDNDDDDDNESENIFNIKDYEPIIDPVIEHEVDEPSTNEQIEISTNILLGIRNTVRASQVKQAKRMETRSKKFMPQVNIGDFVILPILDVDRGLTDPPNLVCRIVDFDFNTNLHELVCEAGILNILFVRNCFDLESSTILNFSFKLDTSVSVRQAVGLISVGGGQGMIKCNCTSSCATNRCSCKKSQLLCNSRCHGGNSLCKNK